MHKTLERLSLTFQPSFLSATWIITDKLLFLYFITLVDTHISQRRVAEQ